MRVLLGVSFVAALLAAAGCQATGRNGRAETRPAGPGQRPFLGSPPADSPSTNLASTGATVTPVRGFLAGQVLDRDNRRVPNARIQVIDIDRPKAGAPLIVLSNREGYFDISGLEKGRHYRLVAELRDGHRLMTGKIRVVANNSRLVIFLNDEEVVKEPPPPDKGESRPAPAGPPSPSAEDGKAVGPAAALDRPIRPGDEGVTTPVPGPSGAGPVAPAPGPTKEHDPSLIAGGGKVQDGFQRSVPSEPANIGGPGREPAPPKAPHYTPPPLPPTGQEKRRSLPPSTAPPARPAAPPSPPAGRPAAPPAARLRVPSCILLGGRLEDFALHDFDGNVWQYSEKGRGKLILLDFWASWCGPCLRALPSLVKLQNGYGPFGLQVVGIAYEEGNTIEEKQRSVRQVSARYQLNYPILFGGGRTGRCPVRHSFGAQGFPTMVLLAQDGRILWEHQGHDARSAYELEIAIRRQLHLPAR